MTSRKFEKIYKKCVFYLQWASVLWCLYCAFQMTTHERDMYRAYYEINMIREGYKAQACGEK